MKKLLLTAILAIGSISAHANEIEISEPLLWENLYSGQFSLSHKLVLTRPCKSTNDEILGQFMMAYLSYRMGEMKQAESIFKGIDSYVEYHYLRESK